MGDVRGAQSPGRQSGVCTQMRWLTLWCLAAALQSCVHAPRDTYLERGTAAKFAHVALHVSSTPVRVRYHSENAAADSAKYKHAAMVAMFGPLVWGAVLAGETAVQSSKDEGLAAGVRESTTQSYIETVLVQHFLKSFDHDDFPMRIVSYANGAELPSSRQLVAEGYDAAIDLDVSELSLVKVSSDALAVHAEVVGTMVDVKKDEVVWKRQVAATSTPAYSLDSYHGEDGLLLRNTVDRLFGSLAAKLSRDIIYSR